MKYISIYLKNYIGIYQGLGKTEIYIDFTRNNSKVCVIRGTNGSGKTTLMNAISLFPESNSSFIPEKPAVKKVNIVHKGTIYQIQFYHDIKSNGDRDNTKAYIARMSATGALVEMNPNGNVSKYKEIIYDLFTLDTNFLALSKLSMDDRGLGYKRPAERKKFVNAIIDSLEVYNDINKSVSKKVNAIKTLLNSIVTQLGKYGSREDVSKRVDGLVAEIDEYESKRTAKIAEAATIQAKLDSIDPSHDTLHKHHAAQKQYNQLDGAIRKDILSFHHDPCTIFEPLAYLDYLHKELDRHKLAMQWFQPMAQSESRDINSYLTSIANLTKDIEEANSRINAVAPDYIHLEEYMANDVKQMQALSAELSAIGIDPLEFTKDEYILALNTVHQIIDMVDTLRSTFAYDIIHDCVHAMELANWGMPKYIDVTNESRMDAEGEACNIQYNRMISELNAKIQLVSNLQNRPTTCKDDTCYFVADMVKVANENPKEALDKLLAEYNVYTVELEQARKRLAYGETYNACLNSMRNILRAIDMNDRILIRLPNGGIFGSKTEFFGRILEGASFEYFEKLYGYIALANCFEEYQKILAAYNTHKSQYEAMKASASASESIVAHRDRLVKECEQIKSKLNASKATEHRLNQSISLAAVRIKAIEASIEDVNAIIDKMNLREQSLQEVQQTSSNLEDIKSLNAQLSALNGEVKYFEDKIYDLRTELSGERFALQRIDELTQSMKEYEMESEMLEKLRKYSSPTTGIQLVFMSLYMGKILDLANELLSHFFGGEYRLQPFVINEDEFRIPCSGNGYLNDDISSMSSSQLTTISMILSFVLLHLSSSDYNVIKLDEIDDPFDEYNRSMFAIVMEKMMQIMGVEQCFMISHSSELIVSDADVITLRQNEGIDYA